MGKTAGTEAAEATKAPWFLAPSIGLLVGAFIAVALGIEILPTPA